MRVILHAIKGKNKTTEKRTCRLFQEQFLLEREFGLMLNQGNSFSDYEVSKKVTYLLPHAQQVYREEDGAVQFWSERKSSESIPTIYLLCLTIDGKYAWQQEKEYKGDSSTVLMLQEQLFISELFNDIQDAILLILHYRTR